MSMHERIFYDINDFARDTPWLRPIVSAYANDGVVLFAVLLLAGWWIGRRAADVQRMVAAAVVALVFARVYIGAHYPQDVLAGLVLGAAVSLAGYALVRPLLRWLLGVAAGSPLRILMTASAAEPVAVQRGSR